MNDLPLIARAREHSGRVAVISGGESRLYRQLLRDSVAAAFAILDGRDDLEESRVGFLFPSSYEYLRTQWAIWRAGGIALPLSPLHPAPEIEYILRDSGANAVIAAPEYAATLLPIALKLQLRVIGAEALASNLQRGKNGVSAPPDDSSLPPIDHGRRAMILYTSGTTGRPKGVVTTHRMIQAQIESPVEAWEWSADDRILQFLPLHHIHGIVNIVGCALWSGATLEMLPKFDADAVWRRIEQGGLTVFMAVPTIYAKLAAAYDAATPEAQAARREACRAMRLMVSGSAALPIALFEKWEAISGHRLLERYGMTEIGMALGNPYHGDRVPGTVGMPMPDVRVRLVDSAGEKPVNEYGEAIECADGEAGEIQVAGPTVFREYWQRPEASDDSFDGEWFKTGDVAVRVDGRYRILGRASVDIIKSGGYKISALEVEEVLREHECIADCAVVGIPDPEWGEIIGAAIVLKPNMTLDASTLNAWLADRLAGYKKPRRLLFVDDLPRNAMGKAVKPEVSKLFA